jgi:phenylpropionate dioxygenase-like ring-hydroxylating dioxygenase large terminal subunit
MTYLRNAWYAAAHSEELGTVPLGRILLDTPVVLYRRESGEAVALKDRCPHRFVPLSRGRVVGDDLQCGYHGLRFGASGACTFNPHSEGFIPRAARVLNYPVLERYGFIWLWPGDPDRADPKLLPDFGFLADPEQYAVVRGYLHVKASYQLVIDNLLDLTHAPYVHPAFATDGMTPEQINRASVSEVIEDERSVLAKRTRVNLPPNRPTREIYRVTEERVDARLNMRWFAPALIHFDSGATPTGRPASEGLCLPAAHAITPETELTCHYWFAQARNRLIDDGQVSRAVLGLLDTAFREQDAPMIEAQQRALGATSDLMSLKPVLLATDSAPVRARRKLAQLIEAEQRRAVQEDIV